MTVERLSRNDRKDSAVGGICSGTAGALQIMLMPGQSNLLDMLDVKMHIELQIGIGDTAALSQTSLERLKGFPVAQDGNNVLLTVRESFRRLAQQRIVELCVCVRVCDHGVDHRFLRP